MSNRQSTEFQVFPQTGRLPPPACGPGALITVGFVPRSYGRTCVTRLVVQVGTAVGGRSVFYFLSRLAAVASCGLLLQM